MTGAERARAHAVATGDQRFLRLAEAIEEQDRHRGRPLSDRERLNNLDRLLRIPRRRKCESCGIYFADPPSRLCPGCEAYQEHQR